MGGKALGRWANEDWNGQVDQVVLMELPIAGSLLELRLTGFVDGLRTELPRIVEDSARPPQRTRYLRAGPRRPPRNSSAAAARAAPSSAP